MPTRRCWGLIKRCPLIIGHRGNTERWIKYYLSRGADGVEIDVYLHGGGVRVGHPYRGSRPALLREKVARFLMDFHVVRPVTLERAVEVLKGRVLWLDLKDRGLADRLINDRYRGILASYSSNLVFSTKYHIEATKLKRAYPEAVVLLSLQCAPANALSLIEEAGADGISLETAYVTEELVDEVKSGGYLIAVWTVNDEDSAVRAALLGVDYVVSDYVEMVGRVCERMAAR